MQASQEIEKIIESITKNSFLQLNETLPDDVDKTNIIHSFENVIENKLHGVPSVFPPTKPFILNIAGIPGAGKTSYYKNLKTYGGIDISNVLYVSFDNIMMSSELPYSEDAKKDLLFAFSRWEIPSRLAGYELLRRAIKLKLNIVFEHSSTVKQHIDLFKLLMNKLNYEVHFKYISVDINVATKRVLKRTRRGGRMFPLEQINQRQLLLTKLLPEYKNICTSFEELTFNNAA